jgi:predicted phosphodiesterase
MPDQLLLRFRNLTPGLDTISEHNRIALEKGRVLWGWWKKPPELMPDPGLLMVRQDLRTDSKVLLVDSADGNVYEAPLLDIHYQPGGTEQPPPDGELCPGYYRQQSLPAWFELGPIQETPLPKDRILGEYVYSNSNRTAPRTSATAIPDAAIGQPVLDLDFLDSNVSLWIITPNDEIGIRGRSNIVQPLSRGVWPVVGKFALHLSDLHFGSFHAFRNQLSTDRGLRIAKESMLEAILQDLESLKIRDIAVVLVTGDLTWQGGPHEFANALSFFQELGRKLGLHCSQVVIVPGNHDVEWLPGGESPDDKHVQIDDNAELNFSNFCISFYGTTPHRFLQRIHRFTINGRPLTIIALNSCRIESKENAGLGFVGREQLSSIVRRLHESERENELRIALMHHHLIPVNYVEGIPWKTKSVSLMLDAEAVIRNLLFAKVNLALHGHQHQPFASVIRRIVHGFVDPFDGTEICIDSSLSIVGGGSIGVERGHINVIGRNSYNIIELPNEGNSFKVRTRLQSSVGLGFADFHRDPVVL